MLLERSELVNSLIFINASPLMEHLLYSNSQGSAEGLSKLSKITDNIFKTGLVSIGFICPDFPQ
jgi:hypothetical protein